MLSVVIPTFNHIETLPRAIHSACQVRGVSDVVVVDDCSQDGTVEYLEMVCQKNPIVRYFGSLENSGPGKSRNIGAVQAYGKWLTFLDADDEIINEGFLEDALDVFGLDPSISVVKAPMEFFDPVKGYILPVTDPRYTSAVMSSGCAIIIPREMFLKTGGFPESSVFRGCSGGEDVAFMQALLQVCGPLGRIDATSYRVWSRDGSHLDRFLSRTRLNEDGFEFLVPSMEQDVVLNEAVSVFKIEVLGKFK